MAHRRRPEAVLEGAVSAPFTLVDTGVVHTPWDESFNQREKQVNKKGYIKTPLKKACRKREEVEKGMERMHWAGGEEEGVD